MQELWARRPVSMQVQPGFYRVKHVYDGDTILVDMNGSDEKVRMIGVDTPETHDPDTPVQCYGQKASEFTSLQLNDKTVRLESDPDNSNRDRYERLLRYVYSEDGTLINKLLITEGYGFAYTRFPFQKKDEFLSAEIEARNVRNGLWAACTATIKDGVYQTNDAL